MQILNWACEPGDAIVFHGLTVHGAAGTKNSCIQRRVLSTRYHRQSELVVDIFGEDSKSLWCMAQGLQYTKNKLNKKMMELLLINWNCQLSANECKYQDVGVDVSAFAFEHVSLSRIYINPPVYIRFGKCANDEIPVTFGSIVRVKTRLSLL